jgi:hypothetical protein
MGAVRRIGLSDFLRRGVAAGSAALIFALGLFAASPSLHQHLHDGADWATNDHCAVALFASGVSLSVAVTAPLPPVNEWREPRPERSVELYLDSPHYRFQPERGPPVA